MRNARDNRKPLKKKKCKVCRELFQPFNSLASACSIPCAVSHAEALRERVQARKRKVLRKDTRERKKALKSLSVWLSEAQTACNAYIRWRDRNEPCISCQTQKPDIQYCAGHYKTRGGHPELRFHPWNINKQCNHHCNLHLSGNISAYKPRLEEKIGTEAVEWLEGAHSAQKWTIEDAQDIKKHYKDLLKYEQSLIND